MIINHEPNHNCGVHYLSRRYQKKDLYLARIVCKNMQIGDIVTSFTARANNDRLMAEVKEIFSAQKPKGNYGDGYTLYEAMLYIDCSNIPPEMHPKDF